MKSPLDIAREKLRFIIDREDYTFAECSLAEQIVDAACEALAALQPVADEQEAFEKAWPEIHKHGIERGWRGVAEAAWKAARASLPQQAVEPLQQLYDALIAAGHISDREHINHDELLKLVLHKFAECAQAGEPIKDHVIAQTVNELRDVALKFHGHQSLRERIAHVVVPLLKAGPPSPQTERDAEWNAAIEAAAKLCESAAQELELGRYCAVAIRALKKGNKP